MTQDAEESEENPGVAADDVVADARQQARGLAAALASGRERRLAERLLLAAVDMIAARTGTLNLKIAAAAVQEMGEAFEVFAPYTEVPKVTIFGSARTTADDPLYAAARDVAADLAAQGWMIVTGAGPGIMQAGMEGAGTENSIGVSIRLPFEQGANPIIAGDEKYVSMKYFFTRKLMLVKESKGFISLPGGFGTIDETFELLTLTQTGKGLPVPIVLLDTPGDPYWETLDEFITGQLVRRGLVSARDTTLYFITDDCAAAVREIVTFYRNYDSLRYVDDLLVMRLRVAPTAAQLAGLNEEFGYLCATGGIVATPALDPEIREHDVVDLPRIAFTFANHGYGDLRALINAVNAFVESA
ncbi:MAG: TIGR00730 family Rossman fold protein [Ilumatobacteraceae bacterium]